MQKGVLMLRNESTGFFNNGSCLGSNSTEIAMYADMEKLLISIACALFCFVGLVGNVAVILVIYKDRVISRHKQNLYLLSLAVSDACLVVLVVPFSLANELLGRWPFGNLYCRIYLSFDIMLCTASIWNICFIGLDRYVSVSYPTTYRKFRTVSKIRIAILFIWGYSAALSFLPFAGKNKEDNENPSCSINDSTWFIILSTSLSFFLPAFIVWPVYLKIYKVGRNLEINRRVRASTNLGEERTTSVIKGWKTHSSDKKKKKLYKDSCVPDCSREEGSIVFEGHHEANLTETTFSKNNQINSMTEHDEFGRNRCSSGFGRILETPRVLETAVHESTIGTLMSSEKLHPYWNCDNYVATHDLTSNAGTDRNTSSDRRTLSSTTLKPQKENLGIIESPGQSKSFVSQCLKSLCCQTNKNRGKYMTVTVLSSGRENTRQEYEINGRKHSSNGGVKSLSVSSVTSHIRKAHRESFASQTSTCAVISNRERRFVFIISVVMGCFMACWLPFFLTYTIYAICRQACCINVQLFKVFFWLGYLNSAINPILYTIFNKDFRRGFGRLFHLKKYRSRL